MYDRETEEKMNACNTVPTPGPSPDPRNYCTEAASGMLGASTYLRRPSRMEILTKREHGLRHELKKVQEAIGLLQAHPEFEELLHLQSLMQQI